MIHRQFKFMTSKPQIDGHRIAADLYGTGSVYQVRDIRCRKCLERSNPDVICHWIQRQPGRDYEIWVLDASPGELKKIVTANQFILEHENQNHENHQLLY